MKNDSKKNKNIFRKIQGTIKIGFKGIKFAWKKHHFIIPPSYWLKYWNRLKFLMKHKEHIMYYNPFIKSEYNKWLKENKKDEKIEKLKYNPLISIVININDLNYSLLNETINSLMKQTYDNYEIIFNTNNLKNKDIIKKLKDKKIKTKINGEYVSFINSSDTLEKDTLYKIVKVLNRDSKIEMIYTDEDKIDINNIQSEPYFKPDYSPDTLLSNNYISHFTILKKNILDKIDYKNNDKYDYYDLILKYVEITNNIYHLPEILYHSRNNDNIINELDKGKQVIEDALKRRELKGKVIIPKDSTSYIVEYDIKNKQKISIIIPTKDQSELLKKCIDSIYEKTTYKNYEVIVVNNRSIDEKTYKLFNEYKNKYKNFEVIDADIPFNYSKINNLAVEKSSGEYIVLLNNDTEVITENWLELMLGYAMQNHIGAVGTKLLYKDNTVQHGGIILGFCGIAGHAFGNFKREDHGYYELLVAPHDCGGVTAACLMVSKKKYEEVKGLEEQLEVGFNDVDFNLKLLDKGYYNIFLPNVELYHYESKSRGFDTTPEKIKRMEKEHSYILNKWGEKLTNDKFYNDNLSLKTFYMLDKYNEENGK